jgi:hypothetical protein
VGVLLNSTNTNMNVTCLIGSMSGAKNRAALSGMKDIYTLRVRDADRVSLIIFSSTRPYFRIVNGSSTEFLFFSNIGNCFSVDLKGFK